MEPAGFPRKTVLTCIKTGLLDFLAGRKVVQFRVWILTFFSEVRRSLTGPARRRFKRMWACAGRPLRPSATSRPQAPKRPRHRQKPRAGRGDAAARAEAWMRRWELNDKGSGNSPPIPAPPKPERQPKMRIFSALPKIMRHFTCISHFWHSPRIVYSQSLDCLVEKYLSSYSLKSKDSAPSLPIRG